MKRAIVPAAVGAAAVLVFVVVNTASGSSSSKASSTVRVVEHATTDAVTNGKTADSVGNVLTFANAVYDAKDAKKVGRDQGYCIRIGVGKSWE